jgi:hypothetical protein
MAPLGGQEPGASGRMAGDADWRGATEVSDPVGEAAAVAVGCRSGAKDVAAGRRAAEWRRGGGQGPGTACLGGWGASARL